MVVWWDFYLLGGDWNMTGLFFHSVGNFIIPVDELIFFRGVGIPPTSRCVWSPPKGVKRWWNRCPQLIWNRFVHLGSLFFSTLIRATRIYRRNERTMIHLEKIGAKRFVWRNLAIFSWIFPSESGVSLIFHDFFHDKYSKLMRPTPTFPSRWSGQVKLEVISPGPFPGDRAMEISMEIWSGFKDDSTMIKLIRLWFN